MLKQGLLLSVLILTAYVVKASDSVTVSTELGSAESILQDNYKDITDLKTKLNNLENTITAFQTCEAKNMVYLGVGVTGSDSDNCVDIQTVTLKRKSIKPTFAGYLDDAMYGNLTTSTSTINQGDTSQTWGRLRADMLCKTKYGANARAMTISDIKYTYADIGLSGTNFAETNVSGTFDEMWIFDTALSYNANNDGSTVLYNMSDALFADCNAYTVATTVRGSILTTAATIDNKIHLSSQTCSSRALVPCVSE